MHFGTHHVAPRVRMDGGKVVIDVDPDEADILRDYLRRRNIRTTAHLDTPNQEARLTLWDRDEPDHIQAVLKGWGR